MSELKSFIVRYNGKFIRAYEESEADKVIAEKDAKILALDAEVFKEKHHAKLFFDERNYAEAQLRHHKYKRCLAMAKWCDAEFYKLRRSALKDAFWLRWSERWMEIATKFKEAK